VCKPALTGEERELLKNHFLKSPIALIRAKAQAVLMIDKGLDKRTIAQLLFKNIRTIQRYVRDFSERRIASLFSGHVDNENAGKLTRRQKEQIKTILKKPPSEYGLPKEFWDIPTLKTYIKAEFGVVYESVQSYHFILKFSNLSFKYPDKYDINRNEAKIFLRIREIKEEIKPFLKDSGWEIFTADETRIVLEALTRRAWLQKGKRTVVKVKRSKEYQNYLGFLNQKNFQCHVYQLAWQNQEEIIKAFKDFLKKYPNKRICIIWDNATFHRGIKIKQELARGGLLEKVHLINLPAYAPDFNPIEHVWKWTKDKISNQQFRNFEITKQKFIEAVNSRTFRYQM
jgi:transposase